MSCTEVVDRWYKQKQHFDSKSPEKSRSAGQFTQLLWKSSTFLGCGLATHCEYRFITVCYYFPPGNIKDEYDSNLSI
ncbi:hypothetical protein B4U80_00369 [Leptotrombidium deliense]|uniref:SCP domain-containing protein n=1 Tax=Leptotrombidium deliense TaxID=299467 RepID=A0A443SNJ4_9ACAR|nr:hypothetical protein B4U80_00369 [Leptotrombidium deliense]